MTPGRIAARLLHPLAWHRMDLRGRLMWLAMLPVLVFAVVWGSYVIRQRDADLAAQLQQRAQLLARQLAVAADYGIFSFNQAALDNIALGVLRESSVISATIIAADGRVLATRHAPAQGQAIPPGQLQAMLDGIFPKLMPLLVVLGTWYLMARRNVSPVKAMLGLLVVAFVGVAVGLF